MSTKFLNSFYSTISDATLSNLAADCKAFINDDVRWCVAHPVNDLQGLEQVVDEFLIPLRRALPDLERRPFASISGVYEGQSWIDGCGYFVGTFENDLFGIPATGRTLNLRYTELVRLDKDRIVECYMIPDFIDVMDQAGVNPLRQSLGRSGLVMPPRTMDGLRADSIDSATIEQGVESLKLVEDMLACLHRFDGKNLLSMDLENYWENDFMWYGPAGIGTSRGIEGFRRHHQGPFLRAFPDRSVDNIFNFIGNGNYAATGGWPHMSAMHTGAGWLGLPPTDKKVTMRVMDIWRRQGNLLAENWVAIDLVHILLQLGLDVFEQMQAIRNVVERSRRE